MNSLSWFLYAADLLTNLSIWFAVLMTMLGIAGVVVIIAGAIASDDQYGDEATKHWAKVRGMFTKIALWFVVCGFITTIIPSKDTMYAIAASQIAEKVATSDIGNDAVKALHSWIKKQIEPEAKK